MNEKQKLFADEYIKTLNATESYKRVYKNCSKEETIRANASRLLTNDNVKKYIEERMKEIQDNTIADAKEVIQFLTKGMRGELKEEVVVTENIGDYCSEARKIEKQISLKEALKCAELLGKRYAIFTDKVEQDTDIKIKVEFTDED